MTLQSLFTMLPAILTGGVLVHFVWPDRGFKSILFKLFLGIGFGLGINSFLFFIFLLLFNRTSGFLEVQIFITVVLALIVILRERSSRFELGALKRPTITQVIFLALVAVVGGLGLILFVNVALSKPQGAWDSWMIYNRAARFIYRGGEHWRDAFSPAMYWFFHADYPPLVALNVASGWNALGQETVRVPMLLGGVFVLASGGIMFAGMNVYKTLGQASLALLALFGVSDFIGSGASQVADVPLAFFILATGILLFLYSEKAQRGLLVLAGMSAGLAAWTKNEGIFFVLASLVGVRIFYWKERKQVFLWYLLGLALPVLVLVYFKVTLAPPGDLFVDLPSQARQIGELDRHQQILKQLRLDLNALLNWKLLLVYALVLGIDRTKLHFSPLFAALGIILLQLAGYYAILLISPHPVLWHLSALYRLLLQIGPLILFVYFCAVRPPETIFQPE